MLHSNSLPLAIPLTLAACFSGVASAQSFDYSFDAGASALNLDVAVTLDFAGDLAGAYDALTNPSGTRTLLGIFGDNGLNNDVPVSITLGVDLLAGGALDGTFDLDFDQELGTVVVNGTSATIGAGTTNGADLSVTLTYDTFRTVNPGSAYIGGFPLTLPLGTADVTDLVLTQSGPGIGAAVPSASFGSVYDVTVGIPVELSFMLDVGGALGGGGAPTLVGPLPLVLPLVGSFDLADCGNQLDAAISLPFTTSIPSPLPFDLTDVPLPLPTILPPGSTADLVLNASLTNLGFNGSASATVIASASAASRVEAYCDSMPNSSGLAGVLGVQGSSSVSAADLVLVGTELPTDSLGYMLMSQDEAVVPGFGGSQGTLCLGGTLYRFSLSVLDSGMLGEIAFAPDFSSLPQGQQFLAAESWNFQYWFRDANPGPTSNTTGAVRVTFCN